MITLKKVTTISSPKDIELPAKVETRFIPYCTECQRFSAHKKGCSQYSPDHTKNVIE